MFRLTRETRFAINDAAHDPQLGRRPTNSYGGYPSLVGFGRYYALQVTLAGELSDRTSYLRNIKEVDDVIRRRAIGVVADAVRAGTSPSSVVAGLARELNDAWPGAVLDRLALVLSRTLSVESAISELPMVRLSQKFEFSASHRLHNPLLSADENRKAYGKCNNPNGHGHNYEVQVTLRGEPDNSGLLVDIPDFERVVAETVIEPLDHKHLNTEVAEFRKVIPSVENIAQVIYTRLKPRFQQQRATLASVTVWETPKTWCEFSE